MLKRLLFPGILYNLRDIARIHVQETFEFMIDLKGKAVPARTEVECTSGLDGSGKYAMWGNTPRNQETNNRIFGGTRFFKFTNKDTGEVIFVEQSLGPDSERGWFLEKGKETDEALTRLYEFMESEVAHLNANPITMIINGQQTEVSFKMSITQCDNKCFFSFCGDGSAFCKQCHVNAKDGNKKENIARGFPVTKTMETQKQKFIDLQQHPIILNGGNFMDIPAAERNGMCANIKGQARELPKHVNQVICCLHIIINTLHHEETLGQFVNARLEPGMNGIIPPRGPRSLRRRTKPENKAIEDSLKSFKKECWEGPARLRIGQPDMANG